MTPPDSRDRRPPLVPPHVAWPALIVLLLAMSISAAVITVFAARSDGGVRLVETAPAGAAADTTASAR
jgi:hypothetical protein